MSKEERRLVEQELVFERDKIDGTTEQDISSHSESLPVKKQSPVPNFKKKLTVVEESVSPREKDSDSSQRYHSKESVSKVEPVPRVDEKGKMIFEFKENNLPELNIEMLAMIRDQLLLQKMYENDLDTYK